MTNVRPRTDARAAGSHAGANKETPMLIRTAMAGAALAAAAAACTPPQGAKSAAINDKVYAVMPADLTVKGPVLRGALTEI